MINFKQRELIDALMDGIKKRFPEVELIDVIESPEDPKTLWIRVTTPDNEDREIDLIEFSGDLVTDIHIKYGHHMLVMPTRRAIEAA
jgi:hypothetical protein